MTENIVNRIAKLIDSEGAFATYKSTGDPDAPNDPYTTRQLYHQAKYRMQAIAVLEMVLPISRETIQQDIQKFTEDEWIRLGMPVSMAKEMSTMHSSDTVTMRETLEWLKAKRGKL